MCAAGWSLPSWDLTAGYVAGRLVATGHESHIYDQADHDTMHDPHSAWAQAAAAGGIRDGVVTPYVQTPLYAWFVSGLAGRVDFAAFRHIFLILAAISSAALIFVSALQWAPALMHPLWQACLLAGFFFSVPNETAVALGQTHVHFLLLAVLAIIAAQRGRPMSAGALLALAATVKISPAWIAVTWLARGNWRAAASFAAFSAVLLALALLQAGSENTMTFLHGLRHAGHFVTLTFNNDSLASVLLWRELSATTAFNFVLLPMPLWVQLACFCALAASAVGAGVLDRRTPAGGMEIGPVLTLIAATAFTPLAWNHYYIVLVVPLLVILDAARLGAGWKWALVSIAVVVLNFPPLAFTVHAPLWVVALRSQFWAAVMCMGALILLQLSKGRRPSLSRQTFVTRDD
jgi:hypothetical protein